MCHRIWKVVLEEGEGTRTTLLVRSGMETGFEPRREVLPGQPRPVCRLIVDDHGAMRLSAWFDGKNVRPISAFGAGETFRVGAAELSIMAPPVALTDGKMPKRPRASERSAGARAWLEVENLDPDNIRIVGPVDGLFELDPSRSCTLGIVPEADIQVIGASIGGRRNSRLRFDAAHGRWTILHLGNSLPVYVNGEDIQDRREVELRDGDCFEPGGQAGVHLRFYEDASEK